MVEQGATLVLVIGSETSSNAQRLVEVAQAAGAAGDARRRRERGSTPRLLDGHATIGLTAGASTPEELVRATAARLAARGYATLEEITVATRGRPFPAAEGGRTRMTSIEVPYSIAAALPTLSVMDITNDVRADGRALGPHGRHRVHPRRQHGCRSCASRSARRASSRISSRCSSGWSRRASRAASGSSRRCSAPRSEQVPFVDGRSVSASGSGSCSSRSTREHRGDWKLTLARLTASCGRGS